MGTGYLSTQRTNARLTPAQLGPIICLALSIWPFKIALCRSTVTIFLTLICVWRPMLSLNISVSCLWHGMINKGRKVERHKRNNRRNYFVYTAAGEGCETNMRKFDNGGCVEFWQKSNWITQWNTFLIDKLTLPQLHEKFPALY